MRYRTLALVAIRVVGIYLLANAIPVFIQSVSFSFYDRFIMPANNDVWWRRWGWPLIAALRLTIALYLSFGGYALLNMMFPRTHVYCPSCGHDSGTRDIPANCPQCGFSGGDQTNVEPTP